MANNAPKVIATDIAIVGAGLVGLTAAIALSRLGYQVTLVDCGKLTKRRRAAWDTRMYALTQLSQQWLAEIGLWAHVDEKRVNPIGAMHLWHEGNHAKAADLVLNAEDANLTQMGCIVESQNLMVAAWQALKASDVRLMTELGSRKLAYTDQQAVLTLENRQQIATKLLIGADGVNSWVRQYLQIGVRQKAFNQTAIVANFKTTGPHHDIAKQWFGQHETLALLPMPGDHVSLVWAKSTKAVENQLTEEAFNLADGVIARTQLPQGCLTNAGDINTFLLQQQTANRLIAERCVLIGDAAHQVHPMAGQGVNLGFKGVMALEKAIAPLTAMHDVGDVSVLRQYERTHKQAIAELNGLTSGLDVLFALEQAPVKQVLAKGMQWLNQASVIKKQLVRHATS